MATFVTMLRYGEEGIKGVGANRTVAVKEAIKRVGGAFVAGYELLGSYDAMIIVEYPDEQAALKANVELNRLIGVSSNTMIAIPISDSDQDFACFL